MFYFLTIGVPGLIILLNYFLIGNKSISYRFFVRLYSQSFFLISIYAGIIYFLELGHYLKVGWVSYSLIFFLIPAFFILITLNLINLLKREIIKNPARLL